jgi:SpoVK/Ycf46/Vps4 family AAA+-type ATPase
VTSEIIGQALQKIVAKVRNVSALIEEWGAPPGKPAPGTLVLFTGPNVAEKAIAARTLANETGKDLSRVDLGSVVTKYIGETEKNLQHLFDAAEASGAVLFFDEADALFGKRSDVPDAHDRYANLEVSYLLQLLESYSGLAILALNDRSNLDEAFIRRIHVIVEFPPPEIDK